MEKIDIKALARELRGDETGTKPNAPLKKKAESNSMTKKKAAKATYDNTGLLELISKVNQRNDYNTEGCIYIDSDIHDLLRQIKVRKKLKIGYLVSWLIERFIQEHRENIASLLKPAKNRFMEK
jgi:hypothetical protein